MLRRTVLFATLLLSVACASGDDTTADSAAGAAAPSAAAPASTDDDLADVTAYELTMDRMDRFYAVQRALGTRMAAMSPAEREAIDVSSDADDSIEESVRKLEGNPTMAAALREGGMSAREFTTMTAAVMQAAMAAGVLQTRPEADQDSLMREMKVNPANVRFLRENEAVLQRKQAELAAELRRLGLDTAG